MAEDWNAIAAEVDAALRSVADVGQLSGFPATLRKGGAGAPSNPWDPPAGAPTYYTVYVVLDEQELKDINGTLIGQTARKVLVSGAAGVAPSDDDQVVLGQDLTYVDEATDSALAWEEIMSVLHLAPAGVAVLYELTLG